MDTAITAIYCFVDDLLKTTGHREDPQCTMSDAEVITTAVVAARYFGGNFERARDLLDSPTYIPKMLSPSQFNRRLHRLGGKLEQLFLMLCFFWRSQEADGTYLIDSFPVPVCDNIRISRSRIYQGAAYRGYIASKRRFFYGLKIHMLTTKSGRPLEMFFTPGRESDTAQLKNFDFDLPGGATVYGDKAYNEYLTEDLLKEAASVELLPLRKKNSKRKLEAWTRYVQHYYRKGIETAGSLIERLLPKSIHAVTAEGFELKVFLFVLAYSLDGLL